MFSNPVAAMIALALVLPIPYTYVNAVSVLLLFGISTPATRAARTHKSPRRCAVGCRWRKNKRNRQSQNSHPVRAFSSIATSRPPLHVVPLVETLFQPKPRTGRRPPSVARVVARTKVTARGALDGSTVKLSALRAWNHSSVSPSHSRRHAPHASSCTTGYPTVTSSTTTQGPPWTRARPSSRPRRRVKRRHAFFTTDSSPFSIHRARVTLPRAHHPPLETPSAARAGVGARRSSRVPVPRDDARARRHTKIRTLACTAAEAFAAIDANMVVGRVERVEVTPRRGRRVRLSDHTGLAKKGGVMYRIECI